MANKRYDQFSAGNITANKITLIGNPSTGTLEKVTMSDFAALQSYQNSAMSAPVMAYIFYDNSGNIYRVYEPTRNNDVSRSQFAYADSIDKFPFDNTAWYGNTFSDVKLLNISANAVMYDNRTENAVIDIQNASGFIYASNNQKGNRGTLGCPNGAEIYVVGDGVVITGNMMLCGESPDSDYAAVLDSLGDNAQVVVSTMGAGAIIKGNGHACVLGSYLGDYVFMHPYSKIELTVDSWVGTIAGVTIFENSTVNINDAAPSISLTTILQGSTVNLTQDIYGTSIGIVASVNTTDGKLLNCSIGDHVTYAPSVNKTDVRIENIGGTSYELGVTLGAVTATAV